MKTYFHIKCQLPKSVTRWAVNPRVMGLMTGLTTFHTTFEKTHCDMRYLSSTNGLMISSALSDMSSWWLAWNIVVVLV